MALAALPAPGIAKVYECRAEDGTRTFSDQPCPQAMQSPFECEDAPNSVRTFNSTACRNPSPAKDTQRDSIFAQPHAAATPPKPATVTSQIGDQILGAVAGQVMRLLAQFWWLAALLLSLALTRVPVIKGWLGEQLVRITLALGLPKTDYRVFYDVTLRGADGTTQIDHLVVSRFGIFVIETKTMKGWIFGQAQDAQWTQQIFRHKSRFQNPLRQNHRHIAVLREVMLLPDEHVHGIVAFVGSAEFKKTRPAGVCGVWGLVPAIKARVSELMPAWSADEIAKGIETTRLRRGRATNRAHIQDLKRRHSRDGPP